MVPLQLEAAMPKSAQHVLSSWKEIAAYLGKGVRTVQRWEEQFAMPVSRPKKAAKGVVIASPERLDKWLATQWKERAQQIQSSKFSRSANGSSLALSLRDSKRLRQANRELVRDLHKATEALRGESEKLVRDLSHSHSADRKRSQK